MKGLKLIIWPQGQWEASEKIAWEGDEQHTNTQTDFATTVEKHYFPLLVVKKNLHLFTSNLDMFYWILTLRLNNVLFLL